MGLCYLMDCPKHVNDLFWMSRSFAPYHLAFFIYLFVYFCALVFALSPN